MMIELFRQPVMKRHSKPYRHTRMFRRRSYGMHIRNRRDLIVHIFGAKYKRLSYYYTQRHRK
jgi:hypothetical protein